MDFLQSVTGKVISGLVALGVIAAGIAWWQMDESTRAGLVDGTARIVGWCLAVLVLPWATFFLSGWAAKFDNNAAGAALVAAYTGLELVLLAWLFDWSLGGAVGWTFFGVGGLFAAAYNLFTCDWLAEKVTG
ncbi:MAG: hypothetical protein ACFCVE_12280 [Phycisphaerae bacterium]